MWIKTAYSKAGYRYQRWATYVIAALLPLAAAAVPDQMVLVVDQVPKDGLVVARVDLTEAARAANVTVAPEQLRAFSETGGHALPAQFIADEGNPAVGTIVLQCQPAQPSVRVRLDFSGAGAPHSSGATTVRTRWLTVVHDPQRMGGLPTELVFSGSGKQLDGMRWGDRLYHREAGQFWLCHDREPRVECLSTGPLCTVVRVWARYAQPDGRLPESQPGAIYDWFYFHNQPLGYVRCVASQSSPRTWQEAHFLELAFSTNGFSLWTGGEPAKNGTFGGGNESHRFNAWGAILEGNDGIGMFGGGPIGVYDGRSYRYLHAEMDAAWRQWSETTFTRTAWLWVGTNNPPTTAVSTQAQLHSVNPAVTVRTVQLQERLDTLSSKLARADGSARRKLGWQLGQIRLLEKHGRFREALASTTPQLPKAWSVISSGDLRLVLERRSDGIALVDLVDAATGHLLGTDESLPLFEITLHDSSTNEVRLTSEQGWSEVEIEKESSHTYELSWTKPREKQVGALSVKARLRVAPAQHRLAWSLKAQAEGAPWSLWQVRFPQLALAAEGAESQLLLPSAAGNLKPVGREALNKFSGDYPGGWMTMQLAALWDSTSPGTGLYFGLHDPFGSTKHFTAESSGAGRPVRLLWDIPVPDMGRPGNRFTLQGEAVWQLVRGDWFDAALIYRDWARREAKWFPKRAADGRSDTPTWMRELCAWALTGGSTNECVPQVSEFARALGVPIGFHWYNWHQIPFDNDYPHYFPTKTGFAEGVKQLQMNGVFVMPYINGRLWDTHDGGTNDFEFTRVARPATTKDPQGEPRVETYGSKEVDGQPVRLAVMCPTTRLWQDRQHDIVLRLFEECGVKGVYMDQIAAAKPELCFDASHGHALGGGSWWNEQGYWPLLDQIRRDKPADRMLTTECNAEPFLRWFDGYLTWHWQYNGQVPLFPAVYGGAIQMFGRAYGGGPTKDLALRMKAGQQLVWGEQLGWLNPSVVREPENFAFFRDAVQLRWHLRRYFYAGQMARPPRLTGDIPNVTADWRWSGVWPVTTSALMGGAWELPAEKRLVLLFANVSDQPVTATVHYDLREAGLRGADFTRRQRTSAGESVLANTRSTMQETVTFPPRSVMAWEMSAKK